MTDEQIARWLLNVGCGCSEDEAGKCGHWKGQTDFDEGYCTRTEEAIAAALATARRAGFDACKEQAAKQRDEAVASALKWNAKYEEVHAELARLRMRLTESEVNKAVVAITDFDWPAGSRFSFFDSPGEHDPCYVVMPCGAMIPLNHHATPGVDIARAKFIVAACNAALSASGGNRD